MSRSSSSTPWTLSCRTTRTATFHWRQSCTPWIKRAVVKAFSSRSLSLMEVLKIGQVIKCWNFSTIKQKRIELLMLLNSREKQKASASVEFHGEWQIFSPLFHVSHSSYHERCCGSLACFVGNIVYSRATVFRDFCKALLLSFGNNNHELFA